MQGGGCEGLALGFMDGDSNPSVLIRKFLSCRRKISKKQETRNKKQVVSLATNFDTQTQKNVHVCVFIIWFSLGFKLRSLEAYS